MTEIMKDNHPAAKPLKLIISIVDRRKGDEVIEILKRNGARGGFVCLGRGTATSDILDLLGIGETEKDIVFSLVDANLAHSLLISLSDEMGFAEPGHGIAFTVPISSVSGLQALMAFFGQHNFKRSSV